MASRREAESEPGAGIFRARRVTCARRREPIHATGLLPFGLSITEGAERTTWLSGGSAAMSARSGRRYRRMRSGPTSAETTTRSLTRAQRGNGVLGRTELPGDQVVEIVTPVRGGRSARASAGLRSVDRARACRGRGRSDKVRQMTESGLPDSRPGRAGEPGAGSRTAAGPGPGHAFAVPPIRGRCGCAGRAARGGPWPGRPQSGLAAQDARRAAVAGDAERDRGHRLAGSAAAAPDPAAAPVAAARAGGSAADRPEHRQPGADRAARARPYGRQASC